MLRRRGARGIGGPDWRPSRPRSHSLATFATGRREELPHFAARETRSHSHLRASTSTTTTSTSVDEYDLSGGSALRLRLLDPHTAVEALDFPSSAEGMTKKNLNLLVRELGQSENEALRPRAELVVKWLESTGYPVDAWMYTELFRYFRKNGKARRAIRLYEKVVGQRPRLRLSSHFYAEAMLALSKGSRSEAAKADLVWSDLLRGSSGGENLSKYALTAFLCCCATSGDWQRALRAFHSDFFMFQGVKETKGSAGPRRKLPDVVACTALMKALRAGAQWRKGEQLLQWMYDNGITPNAYTYAELIGLLGECGQWERVMIHYREMLQTSSSSRKALVPRANVHVFSATMNALSLAGKHDLAQEVLEEMIEVGEKPNAMVLVSLLSVLEKKHEGWRALKVFRYVQSAKTTRMNIFVYNVLLSALSKSEAAGKAREVFDEVLAEPSVEPDRVTYETLIAAYAHVADYDKANQVFRQMEEEDFVPTDYAYAARIKAYAKRGMWRESVGILREVENKGMEPSVHIYNAVLQACFVTKKWELALKLFDRMRDKEIEPNRVTKVLLNRICHEGIESFEDKQRQAATISAIAAAAGALAIRSGIW